MTDAKAKALAKATFARPPAVGLLGDALALDTIIVPVFLNSGQWFVAKTGNFSVKLVVACGGAERPRSFKTGPLHPG